jgi:hypothetical protein
MLPHNYDEDALDAPAGCVLDDDAEPTDAELAAIEAELPALLAEVDLLEVHLMVLDRPPTEVDTRRIRRARNRLMTARRNLANTPTREFPAGGAA